MHSKHGPGLGELLRHLTELVDRGADAAYRNKALNYRPRYTPIMRALADGPCSVSDLTARLAVTQGAVSQTVKLMAADGLVERSSGADARQSIIALTQAGRALLGTLEGHWDVTFEAIQGLEDEIGTPLRAVLSDAISALGRMGFAQRIEASEKSGPSPAPGSNAPPSPPANGHFQTGGKNYARHRPTYPPKLAQALAEPCASRGLAVDVGCGSGQLSVLLAEHFDQVVATDVSGDQLAHAASRANVEYRLETAEAMSAASASADLIVAAQAAHWFDLPRFYDEVRRVGKRGAVVALVSYGLPYLEGEVNVTFHQFYWQKTTRYWPPGRYHVETGYAYLPFPFERLPSLDLSIQRDWDVEDFIGYLKTWSATRRAIAQGQGQFIDEFYEDLSAHWGGADTLRRVVWPIAMVLGRL